MKTRLFFYVMLAILVFPTLGAAAQLRPGPYLSGFIGTTIPTDTTVDSDIFNSNGTVSSYTDNVSFYPGVNAGITIGYDFGMARLEGELSYKHSEIRDITDQSDGYRFRNADGNVGVGAYMLNGFFDVRNDSQITPYLGGGIGLATLYVSDTYGTDTRTGVTVRNLLYEGDNDTVFAVQVGGGLEIALNSYLSLDLGYRYFVTDRARLENTFDQSVRFRVESHNATAGLRLRF